MNDLREIDSLIAEKVMGWRIAKISGVDAWIDDKNLLHHYKDMWHPSIDNTDAWEVVEKLRDLGFYVTINVPPKGKSESCWIRVEDYYGEKYYSMYAKPAPLAICLAALKTVGIEIKIDELINE